MKVILKKRVPNLGYEHDVVEVKNGYAMNFLLPQGLATIASEGTLKKAEAHKTQRVKHMQEVAENAKAMADSLSGTVLTLNKKAHAGGKLYGSITEKQIAEALKAEKKIEIAPDMVEMKEPIKSLGDHRVTLALSPKVKVTVGVKVEEEK